MTPGLSAAVCICHVIFVVRGTSGNEERSRNYRKTYDVSVVCEVISGAKEGTRLRLKSFVNKMLNSVLLFLFRFYTLSLAMLKSERPAFTIFERTERNLKR